MRELTDRIFDCVRLRYPASQVLLKAESVELPGVGHLLAWDLGDGRGRLVAEPEHRSRWSNATELEFKLDDDDSLGRAVEDAVNYLAELLQRYKPQ